MAILVRCPLLAVLGALVASLSLYDRSGVSHVLFLAPILAGGLALCALYPRRSRQRGVPGQMPVFVALLVVASLCAIRIFFVLNTLPQSPEAPRPVKLQGTITLARPWGQRHVAVLETPEGGFLMQMPFASFTEGTRLEVEGVASPLRGAREPGGFDEGRYWRAQGVVARLSRPRTTVLPERWSWPGLRHSISRALVIHMPRLTGAYLRAAWTGQRDPELNEAHRAWGTSHLLAVSGFHVGIVVLCASLILGRGRPLALSVLLWGYVLLTGAAPSAIRAGLMIQAALLARLLGRPASPVNSVCLAAILLLLRSPFLFWDIGWRLSVLAALTITALYGAGRLQGLTAWVALSPVIAVVTFPQVAYTFREVPLVGLLLNLIAPAFFTVAFTVASAVAGLHLLGVPFTSWLLRAVEGGFVLWGLIADCMATLVPWRTEWTPFLAWLGAGTLLFLLCRFLQLSGRRTAILVTGGSLASFLLFLG